MFDKIKKAIYRTGGYISRAPERRVIQERINNYEPIEEENDYTDADTATVRLTEPYPVERYTIFGGSFKQYANSEVKLTVNVCDNMHVFIDAAIQGGSDPDRIYNNVYKSANLRYNILRGD